MVGQENQEGQMCVRLSRPWTGPWKVIKQLSEVVYRIKYCGAVGSYGGVKTRVVHFNQLTPFSGPEPVMVIKVAFPVRWNLLPVLFQQRRAMVLV